MRRVVVARPDEVQAAFVERYRAYGCSWAPFKVQERGCPDGAVGLRGVTDLVEFKSGAAGRLADHQLAWHAAWRGSPVRVVASLEDVEVHIESMRRRAA